MKVRYRNFCKKIISIEYDKSLIRNSQHNNKKLRQAIKDITYLSPTTNDLLNFTDPESSVNEVNSYFSNIGRTLTEFN